MCIIVYKPAGITMPDTDILRECYRNNSDGCGYMHMQKGRVRVRKGFMAFEDFRKSLESLGDLTNAPVVMHFRIGTQGFNDCANTHPFPITSSEKGLIARNSLVDVALVHNGIIPLTTSYNSFKSKTPEKYSDTFYFVKDYASLIIQNEHYHEHVDKLLLLERLAESKLAILGKDGHVELIGKFIEDGGCYYSNDSYLSRTTYLSKYTANNWYDWDTASTYASLTEMTGCFVPSEAWMYCVDDGEMISAADKLFVIDRAGRAYEYDNELDCVVRMPNWLAVDENFDSVQFDESVSIQFFVSETVIDSTSGNEWR